MSSIDLDQTVTPEGLPALAHQVLPTDIIILSRVTTSEGLDAAGDYSVGMQKLADGIAGAANIDQLQGYGALAASLSGKLDASAYNNYYSGTYASLVALQTAHPTGDAGDYAIVDIGGVASQYVWDSISESWQAGSSAGAGTTDTLAEGSVNMYFTSARVTAVGDGRYVNYQAAQSLTSPQVQQALTNLQLNSGGTGLTASDLFRRRVIAFASGVVTAGANATGTFQLDFPSYRLMSIQVDQQSRVRLYDSVTARNNDLGRSIGVDPGQNAGVFCEFIANSGGLVDAWITLTRTTRSTLRSSPLPDTPRPG